MYIQGPKFATSTQHAERLREYYAEARGLPAATSWNEIRKVDQEAYRIRRARRYNLPETSTLQEVRAAELAHLKAEEEAERKASAREFGLPETASEAEIASAIQRLPEGQFYQNYPVDEKGAIVVPATDDEL